jgi:hypothetical protein
MARNSRAASEEASGSSRRPRAILLGTAGWTLLVALSLWWLLHGDTGPSVWIVNEVDSQTSSPKPTFTQHFRAGFRTDFGLQRVYPWVLFGPYVALVAFGFPLERGRLRLGLPLNLAVCIGFILGSRAVHSHTNLMGTNVVIIKAQQQTDKTTETHLTNTEHLEITQIKRGRFLSEPGGGSDLGKNFATVEVRQDLSTDTNLMGALAQLPPALKNPPFPLRGHDLSLASTLLDLLAYGAVLGLAHSVHFYRRFREREHRALLLESNLAQARLTALRAQLQPHFLFNSLNAIATLLRRDAQLAESTLVSLSELLRLALGLSDRSEVTLREEMQFVQRYLEIQQTRFGGKLRFEQEIESTALECLVPTLLLQPLVENAIRHGIEPMDNAGLVRLAARQEGPPLVLTVEDDGAGLIQANAKPPERPQGGTGIGLANLRERLKTLYGSAQKFELLPRAEGGTLVRIEVPWHTVPFEQNPANLT